MDRPFLDSFSPNLQVLLVLAAAPFVGSFLGVLVRRLPVGRPVIVARSACDGCGAVLHARDLVPVVSYVLHRGHCRICGRAIEPFHLIIELAALVVAAWAAWADPDGVWANCVLGWGLLALAWIDWKHLRLPDVLTLPLIPTGLAVAWWADPEVAADHAAAAALGYLLFRGIAWAYMRLRNRDGLGQGDAKLLAVAGAWVGMAGLPPVLLGGALVGIGLALLQSRPTSQGTRVPFGPALALAAWVVRLHGVG